MVAAAIIAVVAIVAIIVGAVLGTRNNNPYPGYSQLTYRLEDTYSGPNFFNQAIRPMALCITSSKMQRHNRRII